MRIVAKLVEKHIFKKLSIIVIGLLKEATNSLWGHRSARW
jgi:hypothetical protein